MSTWPIPGIEKHEIDTPALLIDLDTMESNIAKMAAYFRGVQAHLRPHSKTHKTPILARKQIEAGAQGICCAKLGEAEVMVLGGIKDILIANEVVGAQKVARLVNLAKHARLTVAVDDSQNVADLSAAAQDVGAEVGVLVEVNVGLNRCGVGPGEPALALARQVLKAKGLNFRGLMGYEGHVTHLFDREEREKATRKAMGLLTDTRRFLEDAGIEVAEVSGGATASYDITGAYPGVTEVQAGSYILMDATYHRMVPEFDCALTILTTVISRPSKDRAIIDAGLKVMTPEFGPPQVKDLPGVELSPGISEEHGRLVLQDGVGLRVGDKIELIPSHGCTTINLHDRFYAVRDGRLEAVWEIAGRGKAQ